MSSAQPNTRTRILQSTLELLEASGGKSVRMSDIARHAGISRQALYLHFTKRSELLIAATHYLDEMKESDQRLLPSREAVSGAERLNVYIEAWGNYIPEIYGVAKALIAMGDNDREANEAWEKRMLDMRQGCLAAISALADDDQLTVEFSIDQATDILWTMLSVRNWEQFTLQCGWSQSEYVKRMQSLASQLFVRK